MFPKALKTSLAVLVLAGAFPGTSAGEVVNDVILRVNDRIATLYDYLERRSTARDEILASDRLTSEQQERLLAELPKRVMQQIFRDLLLESRADQMEIFVSAEEVDEEIFRMRERNGIQTQRELEQALASAGMTLEKLRNEFESELRLQRVVGEEVRARVSVTEDDLRRVYRANPDDFSVPEKRRTREVVVLEEAVPSAEARQELAQAIIGRLRAGDDFEAVVESSSEAGTTSSVINLGWVGPGDLDESLEAVLWGLEQGEVSDPIPGRGGLHVLVLEEVEESHVQPFSEVKDGLMARERNRAFNEELEEYLRELAQTAHIVERIPADAQGYRNYLAGPLREPFQILEDTAVDTGEEPSDPTPPTGAP